MPKLEFDKEGIEMFRRGSPSPDFDASSSEYTCARFAFCHGPGFQFCRLSILPTSREIDKGTEKEMRPMYGAMKRLGWDVVVRRVLETGMDQDRWDALEDELDENPNCIVVRDLQLSSDGSNWLQPLSARLFVSHGGLRPPSDHAMDRGFYNVVVSMPSGFVEMQYDGKSPSQSYMRYFSCIILLLLRI